MTKIVSKGFLILGKLSRNMDKVAPRNCEARLTWELREQDGGKLEFSACGEVWNHLKSDIITGGQCVDTLAALFPHNKRAQRICETWTKYHLNGMNAGTHEQSAALEKGRAEIIERMRAEPNAARMFYDAKLQSPNWHAIASHLGKSSSYDLSTDILRDAGMLSVPVTDELRAAAMGGLPEGATEYSYGSRWLYYSIPDETIALIRNGFQPPEEEEEPADTEEAGEPDRDLIEECGLTLSTEFIPWSKSRNSSEKQPSLNWRVTLKKDGRDVLTTYYSAGSAHCPAHKHVAIRRTEGARGVTNAVKEECETGKEVRHFGPRKPIQPDTRSVIASLLSDASVLDAGGFTEWCSEFGYDADSMKARKIYDECLEHALAFRRAVGSVKFAELRAAAQ